MLSIPPILSKSALNRIEFSIGVSMALRRRSDLRFYVVGATGSEPVTLRVRSNEPPPA
jgi:hypothetical protein